MKKITPSMRVAAIAVTIALLPSAAHAASEEAVLTLLFGLVVILLGAKLAGHLAVLAGQPSVLGELVAGIVLGNLHLAGIGGFGGIIADPYVGMLAEIGVVVLLFQVGLESTVRDILKVGLSSLLVAVLGVAAPFALGWLVGSLLLPDASVYVHAFLGATLCATSVAITARVLEDLGKSRDKESRIILGAAVIDDVLGLIVLASVSGAILAAGRGEKLGILPQALIALKACGFLAGALLVGSFVSPKIFSASAKLRGPGVLIGISLGFCFLLSALAGVSGLAPIVGAFAAGLILEPLHFEPFGEKGIRQLEDGLRPLTEFLAPVFFVLMGARVNLTVFGSPRAVLLALALTAAAVAGKQACSLGVLDRGCNRWAVGIGMIPRGEVGLIFASIGSALVLDGKQIIDATVYSAVVIMVIVTTLLTPPLLKWSLERSSGNSRS